MDTDGHRFRIWCGLIRAEGVKLALPITEVLCLAPTTALFLVYPLPPPLFVFSEMTFLLLFDLALTRVRLQPATE